MTKLVLSALTALLVVSTWCVSAHAAPPANDDFGDAQLVLGKNLRVTGDTSNSTIQPGEIFRAADHKILYFPTQDFVGSVWFKWRPPKSGWAEIDGVGPVLLYTGAQLNGLSRIPLDPTPGIRRFSVAGGETYYLQVGLPYGQTPGTFQIKLKLLEYPNDNFSEATKLPPSDSLFIGSDAMVLGYMTREANEPVHNGTKAVGTGWYKYRTPLAGRLAIVGCGVWGGLADVRAIAVYTGDRLSKLRKIASSNCLVKFRVKPGVRYMIAVAGSSTQASSMTVNSFVTDSSKPPHAYVLERASEKSIDRPSGSLTVSFNLSVKGGMSGFVRYRCRIDRKRFRYCRASEYFDGLRPGRHTVEVFAVNVFGDRQAEPVKWRFRI